MTFPMEDDFLREPDDIQVLSRENRMRSERLRTFMSCLGRIRTRLKRLRMFRMSREEQNKTTGTDDVLELSKGSGMSSESLGMFTSNVESSRKCQERPEVFRRI